MNIAKEYDNSDFSDKEVSTLRAFGTAETVISREVNRPRAQKDRAGSRKRKAKHAAGKNKTAYR